MNEIDNIFICYNEPKSMYDNYVGKDISSTEENIDLSETEFLNELSYIEESLKTNFTNVKSFPISNDFHLAAKELYNQYPSLIFNFVEAIDGDANYESYVAGTYELMGIPFTGNSALSLGNCLNKVRTKQILQSYKIPTPNYQIAFVEEGLKNFNFSLSYPVILKLIKEDASIGISEYSVVNNDNDLKERLLFLFSEYKQDILIEEFIEGRELNVSILCDEALPISEITFDNLPTDLPKIVTYEAKWSPNSVYYKNTKPVCPPLLDQNIESKIIQTAKNAYHALMCRDYARVDIRLKNNKPYVIEVNPNPDISTSSGFVRSANQAGISYEELLFKIASEGLNRYEDDSEE